MAPALQTVAPHGWVAGLVGGLAGALGLGWLIWLRSRGPRELAGPERAEGGRTPWGEHATLSESDAGMRRAEWEVARAAEYGREVTLALIGMDAPARGGGAVAQRALMRRLDELVLASVTRFDAVCRYGSRERLVVLPEERAVGIGEGAEQLCAVAAARLGRHVRVALASYPAHGSSLHELLTQLEVGLATCRLRDVTVQVCASAVGFALDVMGPPRPEPLLVLEPDEGIIGPAPLRAQR